MKTLNRWMSRSPLGLIGLGVLTVSWVACTVLTGLALKMTWVMFLLGWNLL